jgi:hypothetical protein
MSQAFMAHFARMTRHGTHGSSNQEKKRGAVFSEHAKQVAFFLQEDTRKPLRTPHFSESKQRVTFQFILAKTARASCMDMFQGITKHGHNLNAFSLLKRNKKTILPIPR